MNEHLNQTPRTDAAEKAPHATEDWAIEFARELERDYWRMRREGYIVAMELLQSDGWRKLDADVKAAAESFLPASLRARPLPARSNGNG